MISADFYASSGAITQAEFAGYGHYEIKKSLDAGKVSPEFAEKHFDEVSDRQSRTVVPIGPSYADEMKVTYDSRGRKYYSVHSGKTKIDFTA